MRVPRDVSGFRDVRCWDTGSQVEVRECRDVRCWDTGLLEGVIRRLESQHKTWLSEQGEQVV